MASNPACKTFIPMLSAFADGELSVSERQTVERHLSACHDCTGRVADLRATGGLLRAGMDFATDEVDFKDFAQKVMARVTPERPPLFERLRISASEMFLYQRGPLMASFATAAVLVLVAVPLWLRMGGEPAGYASPQMAVQSVSAAHGAKVEPVVLNTDHGDAIIWVVDGAGLKNNDEPTTSDDDEDSEEDAYRSGKNAPAQNAGDAGKKTPTGGEL
jgi:anti-sigma factor RsiW